MLSTDKQTDRQTDRQTNQHYQKHNLLCQGGKKRPKWGSCHRATMVIAVRAHCNPLDKKYIYTYKKNGKNTL